MTSHEVLGGVGFIETGSGGGGGGGVGAEFPFGKR